ncbi:trypsin-like [Littorina saxatilis]|uniref:trypsin-like n=1 Tax=Littorina saxatilis TaxID=31220 RepID=UPI0038B49664
MAACVGLKTSIFRLHSLFLGIVCIACSVAGSIHADSSASDDGSITSGTRSKRDTTQADDYNFPWMVKVRSLGALRCSGVLIDTAWVLTAASCFDGNWQQQNYNVDLLSATNNNDSNGITTSAGTDNNQQHDLSVHLASFYIHGRYNVGQSRHNVALLLLFDNVTSPYIPADVISASDDVSNDECLSVGWNLNGEGESSVPSVQKWRIVNSTVCSQRYNLDVHSDQVCALPGEANKGTCNGDIGSPVMCKVDDRWKLTGIVSHTWRCAADSLQELQPALFLSVQHYLPFVQKRGHFKDIPTILG